MIKLLTGAEMRELDRATAEEFGLAGIVLMEHAGKGVAEAARALATGTNRHITLVCGKGNNGGDGFVAARWLARWGFAPEVFLVGQPDAVVGDAKTNLDLLRRAGVDVETLAEEADLVLLTGSLRRSSLVVDALMGTGLSGPPRQLSGAAVRQIVAARKPVLSVDVPSGLNADTGEAYDPHVVATQTITFGAWKRGLAIHPGAACAGEVVLVDIGLPDNLLAALDRVPVLLEASDVAALLPPRPPEYHKGDAGRALLVGGSRRLAGAALLATRAACRGGAGLVTLAAPGALAEALRSSTPEAMLLPLAEDDDGAVAPAAAETLATVLGAADAIGVGPGLGTGTGAAELLEAVLRQAQVPLVLDADALNLLAETPDLLNGLSLPLVLTPHPGEAARLLKVDTKRILADRFGAAVALSRRFGATAVLKSGRTVIATPQGRLLLNSTGNPAMASGGMGDALTGLITALLAQGLAPPDAAAAGVWLHGRAGDLAAAGAPAGILASDVIERLPQARGELMPS